MSTLVSFSSHNCLYSIMVQKEGTPFHKLIGKISNLEYVKDILSYMLWMDNTQLIGICIFLYPILRLTVPSLVSFLTSYYLTQAISPLYRKLTPTLKTRLSICMFQYLEGDFLDGLYWEYEYQLGDQHRYICPGGEDRIGPCPLDVSDRNILYENRLLGLPRWGIKFNFFSHSCILKLTGLVYLQ